MGILDKLKSITAATPASVIAETIPHLHADREAAVTRLTELEAGREHVIFAGGNIDAVNKEIAEQRVRIETIDIAIAGAERRRGEAEKREHDAAVEARAADGPRLIAEEINLRKALHSTILDVVAGIVRLREIASEQTALSTYLAAEGRPDLKTEHPRGAWNEAVRRERLAQVRRRNAALAGDPVNLTPGNVMDMPLPEGNDFHIGGYPLRPVADRPHWLEIAFPELRGPAADKRTPMLAVGNDLKHTG